VVDEIDHRIQFFRLTQGKTLHSLARLGSYDCRPDLRRAVGHLGLENQKRAA
jgi:hypothetical protein